MKYDVKGLDEPELRRKLESEGHHASLGLHLAMGLDAALRILKERQLAHQVLKEEAAARALAGAIEQISGDAAQLHKESKDAKTMVDAITKELAEREAARLKLVAASQKLVG